MPTGTSGMLYDQSNLLKLMINTTAVINDPLGLTHSLASSEDFVSSLAITNPPGKILSQYKIIHFNLLTYDV